MSRRAAIWLICLATTIPSGTAWAQGPTAVNPQPAVTADNEPWYLSGESLTYEGSFYDPVGPLTAFNRNEMVRTGFYRGIPLYTRTTYEPWSVVFVPVSGGYLRPYVRRRSGEIAGTIGSIGPGVPIERDDTSRALTEAPLQAAGPPTNLADTPVDRAPFASPAEPTPIGASGTERTMAPTGTAGTIVTLTEPAADRPTVLPRPRPFETVARPTGANGAYIEFDSARWFSSGPATETDGSFRRIGEYRGRPVYVRGDDRSTIYVPVTSSATTLATRYEKRR